ncbi:MAG: hypothetical protein IKX76_04510 [Eubacterium sp.]|nr:hypothetical protein [Eubacterium sp.]
MLTLIFVFCMFAVFGKLAFVAIKGAWGLTKILFTLIFLPFILIGLVLKGLIFVALPVLVVIGIISLITGAANHAMHI